MNNPISLYQNICDFKCFELISFLCIPAIMCRFRIYKTTFENSREFSRSLIIFQKTTTENNSNRKISFLCICKSRIRNIIKVSLRKRRNLFLLLKTPNRIATGDCSKAPRSFRAFIEQKVCIHYQ